MNILSCNGLLIRVNFMFNTIFSNALFPTVTPVLSRPALHTWMTHSSMQHGSGFHANFYGVTEILNHWSTLKWHEQTNSSTIKVINICLKARPTLPVWMRKSSSTRQALGNQSIDLKYYGDLPNYDRPALVAQDYRSVTDRQDFLHW